MLGKRKPVFWGVKMEDEYQDQYEEVADSLDDDQISAEEEGFLRGYIAAKDRDRRVEL